MHQTNLINSETIINDLINLGIEAGDTIFLTANVGSTGFFEKSRVKTLDAWIKIFNDLLGPDGTLIMAAYTKTKFIFQTHSGDFFHHQKKSYAGPLSNYLITHDLAYRSTHPSCSYVGIGKNAEHILKSHSIKEMSYTPFKRIIELGGKNLMLGTINDDNAPMVMHYCQEQLGITKKRPFLAFRRVFFLANNGDINKLRVNDVGGCSAGGKKLYPILKKYGAIIGANKVGKADSYLIDCNRSFEITQKILIKDKDFVRCDNKMCINCNFNFLRSPLKSAYILLVKILRYIVKR